MMRAGPIMDEIKGLPQHCYTVLRNSRCPYLKFGCLGCTPKWAMFNLTDLAETIRQRREYPK